MKVVPENLFVKDAQEKAREKIQKRSTASRSPTGARSSRSWTPQISGNVGGRQRRAGPRIASLGRDWRADLRADYLAGNH